MVNLKRSKSVGKSVLAYRKHISQGGVKIPLFEKLSGFFGKKGQVLKRSVRYNKGRLELNALIEEARKSYRNAGLSTFKRAEKKESVKWSTKKVARQAETFKRRAKESIAKAELTYSKMLDIFTRESYQELNKLTKWQGSLIVILLEKNGLSDAEITSFLTMYTNAIVNTIPAEARELFNKSDFGQFAEFMLNKTNHEQEDFTEILKEYVSSDEPEKVESVVKMWENSKSGLSFKQLRGKMDTLRVNRYGRKDLEEWLK